MTEEEVHAAAADALESLPPSFRDEVAEVAVVVEDSHPDGIMGIYDPVGEIHRIVIYRDANPDADEVRKTVLHEIGHHFGMDEDDLEELGYG